jgi:hypothetical protein
MFGNENMEPLTRNYLLGLKAQTDEENRVKIVQQYVQQIYNQVKQTATTTPETRYQQRVDHHTGHFSMRNNMSDILDRLRAMFPDSRVDFKSLGQDGKMYDIADIDERMKPFINPQLNQGFIIVDWS